MKRLFLIIAFFSAVMPLSAQRRDSAYVASEQFKWEKLAVPASLITAGAVISFTPVFHRGIDETVRDAAQGISGGKLLRFDDYTQYAPIAAYTVAGLCGAGKHNRVEHLLVGSTAFLTMFGLTNLVKYTVRRERPDSQARNSFPSGHTATAFLGAELVRLEYGPWWGLAAYSVASATAIMRLYNNRHWASDLLAGAAIGILSANIGYWMLPLERRLFHLNPGVRLQALPYASLTPVGSAYGLSLSLSL